MGSFDDRPSWPQASSGNDLPAAIFVTKAVMRVPQLETKLRTDFPKEARRE